MEAKKLQTLISGYGLMEALQSRMETVVVGGVARSTIYKAFQTNGGTPRTDLILKIAEEVVAEHEEYIKAAVAN